MEYDSKSSISTLDYCVYRRAGIHILSVGECCVYKVDAVCIITTNSITK